jgi:hypothetical protein
LATRLRHNDAYSASRCSAQNRSVISKILPDLAPQRAWHPQLTAHRSHVQLPSSCCPIAGKRCNSYRTYPCRRDRGCRRQRVRGKVTDAIPAEVPSQAAEPARDTLGGAVGVADQLPTALLTVTREAFTEGLQLAAA